MTCGRRRPEFGANLAGRVAGGSPSSYAAARFAPGARPLTPYTLAVSEKSLMRRIARLSELGRAESRLTLAAKGSRSGEAQRWPETVVPSPWNSSRPGMRASVLRNSPFQSSDALIRALFREFATGDRSSTAPDANPVRVPRRTPGSRLKAVCRGQDRPELRPHARLHTRPTRCGRGE